ncbi:MAG: hypothetical protein OJF51_004811 [Nitrospira sp.]|nr:MAG: hypothetical protein OJF51_004811 [Nitrospira sp.]
MARPDSRNRWSSFLLEGPTLDADCLAGVAIPIRQVYDVAYG